MAKILVIGGAGYIGSHLCERLSKDNEVSSLDNYFSGNNEVKGVRYIRQGSDYIENLSKPDIIYHLGEYARVLTSFEDVEKVVEFNCFGTMKVLEYCRKNKVRLIYAGSSTKFGDSESPYSFFKKQNTEIIKFYGEWFGLDYAITYFYNVYGGREIKEGKYATFIGICSKNKKIQINGYGSQKRAFTHIDDIIDGLVLVGEKGQGEYCIGNSQEYSILEVAKMFNREIEFVEAKRGDRKQSGQDLTRIKELGWKAKIDLKNYVRSIQD